MKKLQRAAALLIGTTSATVLATVGVVPAHAERWVSADPAGDVAHHAMPDPETEDPDPCMDGTEAPATEETTTDLTRVSVRHRPRSVALALTVRELGDERWFASLPLLADTGAYQIDAWRIDADGVVRWGFSRLGRTFPEPKVNEDGCSTYAYVTTMRECRGRRASVDADHDRLILRIPRRCLNAPRWVRVGASTSRVEGTDFYVDQWTPNGRPSTEVFGPLGPKVRRG
ncbi:hypothetical protein FXB39_08865 [Nocardioides sp. BGMRC 2183]|nr:hypothetical protein FXB39_08865 [Nocardioides sp. BGMRC 2183]